MQKAKWLNSAANNDVEVSLQSVGEFLVNGIFRSGRNRRKRHLSLFRMLEHVLNQAAFNNLNAGRKYDMINIVNA